MTGDEIAVLPIEPPTPGHKDVWSVAFSPDGERLATGSNGKENLRLWDARTGEPLAVFSGHPGIVLSVAFSPDGTRLVSGGGDKTTSAVDKTIRVWDVSTGQELNVIEGHTGAVNSVTFSPDGTRIASGSADKTIRVWDAVTGQALARLRGHEGCVKSVRYSPDGGLLASATGCGLQALTYEAVRLWSAIDAGDLNVWRLQRSVETVDFSPDGARLAIGDSADTVRVFDVTDGELLAVLRGHALPVESVKFSPDGTRLVSAADDRTVRIWDASTGEELAVLRGHEHEVYSAVVSPDGTRVWSGSLDRTVRVWDAVRGNQLAVHALNTEGTRLAFSPDGARLAVGCEDGTVRLWDALTDKKIAVLRGSSGSGGVYSLAFSPDGNRLASVSMGHDLLSPAGHATIHVWDTSTGEELLALHHRGAWHVAFHPDGTRLATGGGQYSEHEIRIWDARTGRELTVLRGHEHGVVLAFSPDGTRLASGSRDRTVRMWDSVPYAQRYQEQRAALEAKPEARIVVDDLWGRLGDWNRVIAGLHKGARLTEPVRRAALNLALTRSARLQERVSVLFARHVFAEDVVAALRDDTELAPDERRVAIVTAQARGDDPHRVNAASWALVSDADKDPESYPVGLRGAEAAVAIKPDHPDFLITLAMGQYRTGMYEQAIATTNLWQERSQSKPSETTMNVLTIQIMSLTKLGRVEEAKGRWAELMRVRREFAEEGRVHAEYFLVQEAENLLKGP